MGPVQSRIESTLRNSLKPSHLEVINESHQHSVPEGSESHFKVIVVAEQFTGKNRIDRHRMINDLLAELLAGPIHALSQRNFTPDEWKNSGTQSFASPKCSGQPKN